MDSFEWNKIAGAVLFALLVSFGLSILSDIVFETEAPETPGYVIAVAESPEAHAAGEAAPAEEPIAALLASADPAAGQAKAKTCGTCHTFGEGESNKIGQNLYGVVMRPIASHEGYEYSAPMQAYAAEAKVWDYEHLNDFLAHPAQTVPKTKMAFAGLKKADERASVIAYLRTLAANPEPLPPPPTDTASLDATAPAAGEAAAPAEPSADTLAASPESATGAPAEPASEAAAPAEPAPAAEPPPAAGGVEVAQAETPAAADAAPAAAAGGEASPVTAAVASADVAKGATVAKRCAACHTVEEGGANKVGPHLWDVVGRPIASVADFNYSDAMKEFSEGGAKTWTLDLLDAYLLDPKGAVPGNKMAFPGLKNDAPRADLLAYLHSLSANPVPLQ